jgi:hypothetical protein
MSECPKKLKEEFTQREIVDAQMLAACGVILLVMVFVIIFTVFFGDK